MSSTTSTPSAEGFEPPAQETTHSLPLARVTTSSPHALWCYALFEQLCEQLEDAHQEDRICGTLAPDQILFAHDPKLMDVEGLEFDAQEEPLRPPPDSLYAPPEAADPDLELDGRADVFSLGAILYEMLTGAPPKRLPPPPLAEARSTLQELEWLDPILQKSMANDRDQRYPSVAHLLAAFKGAREDAQLPRSAKWQQTRKKLKKRLVKYLRKKLAKLVFHEIKALLRHGWTRKKHSKQASKEAAKKASKKLAEEATEQAIKQLMREAARQAAKQASSVAYSAAAAKTAATTASSAASSAAATATFSTAIAVAAQTTLLVAGVALGALGGSETVAVVSQLSAPDTTARTKTPQQPPPRQRKRATPKRATAPPTPLTAAQKRQQEEEKKAQAACPAPRRRINLFGGTFENTTVTAENGKVDQIPLGYCLPVVPGQVLISNPNTVRCVFRLDKKAAQEGRPLSIYLQKDDMQILRPDYCLRPKKTP